MTALTQFLTQYISVQVYYLLEIAALFAAVAAIHIWVMIYDRRAAKAESNERVRLVLEQANCDFNKRVEQMAACQRSFYELNDQRNKITLFMREAYKAEEAEGKHAGRLWEDIVIGYLQAERQAKVARAGVPGAPWER